jgi:hypothetical protein
LLWLNPTVVNYRVLARDAAFQRPARVRAAVGDTEDRACFLGHGSFAVNLAEYRGPKPQHYGSAREELPARPPLDPAAEIQLRPRRLTPLCHIDEGEVGLRAAGRVLRRTRLARG